MKRFRKFVLGAISACVVTMTPVAANAGLIQLGFILDSSGSIGAGNWTTIKNGLSTAVGLIPTSGPDIYEISVVSFSASAQSPTALRNVQLTSAADVTGGPECDQRVGVPQ